MQKKKPPADGARASSFHPDGGTRFVVQVDQEVIPPGLGGRSRAEGARGVGVGHLAGAVTTVVIGVHVGLPQHLVVLADQLAEVVVNTPSSYS